MLFIGGVGGEGPAQLPIQLSAVQIVGGGTHQATPKPATTNPAGAAHHANGVKPTNAVPQITAATEAFSAARAPVSSCRACSGSTNHSRGQIATASSP
jgi:hypothetical protein